MQTIDPVLAPVKTRRTPLFALFVANAVSAIGDVLALIAVPWFVLRTTGSVEQTGITAACTTGGVALSAFFGAAVVDRLGFKRASVVSDLASGIAIALIPALYLTGQLAFPELLVCVFLTGFFATPGATARSALVPDLAPLARMRLERAASATDGIQRLSLLLGAPLAGVLIIFVGTSNLLVIDAASFLFSAMLVLLAVPRVVRAVGPTVATGDASTMSASGAVARRGPFRRIRTYFANLAFGLGFIWRDGVIFGIVLAVMVTNLLDAGSSGVLAPAFVLQTFGDPVVLGTLFAVFGAGALLGTLIFGVVGFRLPRRWMLGLSYTLGGAPRYVALALVPFVPIWFAVQLPVVPVLYGVQFVTGLFLGQINPLIGTVRYERVPAELRARVFGAITAGAMIGSPLGALVAGFCAAWFGVQATLLAFGAVYLLATLSLLVNPAMKHMTMKDMPKSTTTGDEPRAVSATEAAVGSRD